MKYPKLFEPLAIGSAVFRNRIFASPQGYYNVAKDNLPSLDEIAYYERKARGGFASVTVGDCIVEDSTGTHYPFLIRMEDRSTLPGLAAIADGVSRHGAVASAELSHAGMYARFVKYPDGSVYGADSMKNANAQRDTTQGGNLYGPVYIENGKYGEVLEMPEEMILRIIDKFGAAAAWAKTCGFGMVTVHGGHGWLLSQFMSPTVNTRTDRWGGSFENRMRLPLAVIESIRKNVGRNFPIEYRFSGSEASEVGYDIDYGVKFAEAIDGKVDIIHVSAGDHEDDRSIVVTHPSMFMEDGINVKYAAEIKRRVKTPVATVGALTDPEMMEDIIASSKADIVELGRQSLADPDFPLKARTGREDDINKCMRCNTCFEYTGSIRSLRCAINPEIGFERDAQIPRPISERKRVLVAGGGIAGMQAALTASKRGHEVILCEKTDKLGGILRCEANVPFKKHLHEYLDRQAARIAQTAIDLRLNTEVTPELAKSLKPDVIFAALGAVPYIPPIPGIDGANVIEATELYASPEKAGAKVIVIGGGLVGIELSVYLNSLGKTVTIIEALPNLVTDDAGMHLLAHDEAVRAPGITILRETTVTEITPSGVICKNDNGELTVSADTVVIAVGQTPLRSAAFALYDCAPEVYQIGDSVTPSRIVTATSQAYTIARDI
ncbi:MAG: NAD(P)/FAD-dependent oxidoreductase [Oscillospiraceae bacterium]|jgi:2,4-dienoyl-CoA reductase-like NADH-dependent reductase (Old Yellow Enzyme family)/thioredoxin reductase|nr:NAD(P)/FAD-dependent oxidoreductase [Oscillospiraceae bacterium]